MLFASTSRLATVVDRLDARHTWRQQRAAAMEEAGAMGIYESCVSVLPDFSQVGGASDQQRGWDSEELDSCLSIFIN